MPKVTALREARDLPPSVRGPVEDSAVGVDLRFGGHLVVLSGFGLRLLPGSG